MPHNRYYIPQAGSALSIGGSNTFPYVSIDKITTRIEIADKIRVIGSNFTKKFAPNYRWFNAQHGKIGIWACGLAPEVFVTFNPRTIEYGHNLAPYRGDTLSALQEILPDLIRHFPALPITRRELTLFRAGHSNLSEIHLAADFEFPAFNSLNSCLRELKFRWTWRWTRNQNNNYSSSYYLNQRHWTLTAYIKDDEIYENHRNWPDKVKRRSKNRLRLEIRLRRQELLKLGERLHRKYPHLPELDLSKSADWEPHIYPLAFDFYASRLEPIGKSLNRGKKNRILFFELVNFHGGHPVPPRGNQSHPHKNIASA